MSLNQNLNHLLAAGLEKLINPLLRLDPESLAALGRLSGKIICVDVSGLDLRFSLLPDVEGILVLSDYNGEVDVHITAPPFSLLRLLSEQDMILANVPEVQVDGDASVAQRLANIFKGLEVDWEEQVAKLIGDIPAHQLGFWARSARDYKQDRFAVFNQNLSEYLQEELRHLPSPAETEHFLNDVDEVRDDMERLEMRVRKLLQPI